jgi:hypothetical protein
LKEGRLLHGQWWIEQRIGARLLQLHDTIYKGTNGRIGHRFMPGTPPNLLLPTTGATTGQARTTSVADFATVTPT